MSDIKWNILQQPKSPGYLAAFVARPGHKLVSCDLSSIEPRIITEFSRDPNLWKLYGPGAKPNDVYLYNGAHLALFRDEIRRWYDPDNPTAETLAAAKKHCKRTRQFNKTITLACLAEGTLVRVRGEGFVPIEQVKHGAIVWDGTDWVTTDGVVERGSRPCAWLQDVLATDDHQFLTTNGWKQASEIREGKESSEYVRPEQPRGSWAEVWRLGRRIIRDGATWAVSVCSRKLSASN